MYRSYHFYKRFFFLHRLVLRDYGYELLWLKHVSMLGGQQRITYLSQYLIKGA